MKVLIVDDNASMRRMIRGIIQPLAAEIYECEDGGKAFEIYARVFPVLFHCIQIKPESQP